MQMKSVNAKSKESSESRGMTSVVPLAFILTIEQNISFVQLYLAVKVRSYEEVVQVEQMAGTESCFESGF